MKSFDANKCSIIVNNYPWVFFFLLYFVAMLDVFVGHAIKVPPTLYIFGDSTFDVGTNNFLNSKRKANSPYYGIDFHNSFPTGRFSNGLNIADQIARQFGYKKSPPSFLDLETLEYSFKVNIMVGVNFASGGSGILRYTGYKQWGEVIFLEKQVDQFAFVRENITNTLGAEKAASFVSKALFLISIGINDLLDYEHSESGVYHLGKEENLAVLQLNYYTYVRKLYELGARKFGILSIPPIGCYPAVTSTNEGNCVKPLNDFSVAFYKAIQTLLEKLSLELEGFEYSLGNTYAMFTTMLKDPLVFGLNDTKSACCGIGKLNGEGPCLKTLKQNRCGIGIFDEDDPILKSLNKNIFSGIKKFYREDPCKKPLNISLCVNRDNHLFWDWLHITEKASKLIAKMVFEGGVEFVFPKNLSQLVS
ncbi:GDSL esterase/lipase At5g55050-like [Trifolium pratense]|uniref:GDSL esterase/lipase At5g55050-like n=1 Tax=Trifolium pratense TaxID=57577 RepID=UPI001E693775|nr:GDSL esterase/lipase At5g55050-like [Trifolium pratense]